MTETCQDLECLAGIRVVDLTRGAEGIAALKDEGVMTGESHGRSG
jgi:hypothetical protein